MTRAKANMNYYVRESRPVGLRSDQTVLLKDTKTKTLFPHRLEACELPRCGIRKALGLRNQNNFKIDALVFAKIYKARWQIELFFKWIKQNLRVKSFFGLSENAVKTQI